MGEKLKLTSGKEVALHDLTYAQREECENATSIKTHLDGSIEFIGLTKARTLWCLYGLGLEDREKLNQYSTDDLMDIMMAVKDKAEKVNPTKGDSLPSMSG